MPLPPEVTRTPAEPTGALLLDDVLDRRTILSMRDHRLSIVLVGCCVLTLALGGCVAPQRSDYISSRSLNVQRDSEEADRYWTAIQFALRRNRFTLDRVDRQRGVVTTMPVVSQHFLEFWRHDVDTRRDALESSLCPIRRWVEVSISRGDGEMWQELAVTVHKERFSSPDRQFNSSGAAYQVFGVSLPSTTGADRVPGDGVHWEDLGRDPAMEAYLLRRITEFAGAASQHVASG